MRYDNTPFETPKYGHCLPVALACAAEPTAPGFERIASLARTARTPDATALTYAGAYLLSEWGDGMFSTPTMQAAWFEIARVRAVETLTFSNIDQLSTSSMGWDAIWPYADAPRVRAFADAHPDGRWIVEVRAHAIALVDGKLMGVNIDESARVLRATRVEPITEETP